jgi:hypothetical protein
MKSTESSMPIRFDFANVRIKNVKTVTKLLGYRKKESHDCSQSCYNNAEKYLYAYCIQTEGHINIQLY